MKQVIQTVVPEGMSILEYMRSIAPISHEKLSVELQHFCSAIRGHSKELLFLTALFTGMRQGEIIALTWDCINFSDNSINVYRQIVKDKETGRYEFTSLKNSKPRMIFPASFLMELLFQHRQQVLRRCKHSPYVFTSRSGTHYTHAAVYNAFKKLVRKIGYPDIRFHDLRHTYAVLSLQAGDDIKTLQSNMGHHSAAFTLDVYGHCNNDMKKQSALRMDSFVKSKFIMLQHGENNI